MGQNNAIRHISNLKGRESVSVAAAKLNLTPLQERRKTDRHNLQLLRVLNREENHQAFTSSYDELIKINVNNKPITRATARGEPPTIYAKSSAYYNSSLPKTVRELKEKLHI